MKAVHYEAARQRTRAAEVRRIAAHDERMARGCLKCGNAERFAVCPDCYVCVECGPGCDECAPQS